MSATTDRRQSPRLSPDGLAFFKIEPDEGGTVADVSEGGVGFHLISPVNASDARPVKFSFSFDSQNLIYGFGEVAWLDETRKSGGLKFLRVPEEVIVKLRSGSGVFNLYPDYEPQESEMTATTRTPTEISMNSVQTLVQEEPQRAVVPENLPSPQPEATPSTVVPSPGCETAVEAVPVNASATVSTVATSVPAISAEPAAAPTDKVFDEQFRVAPELEPMVQGLDQVQEQAAQDELRRPEPPKSPAGFAAGIKSSQRWVKESAYDHDFSPLPSGPVKVQLPTRAVPVPANDFYGHVEKDPALVQMTSDELCGADSGPANAFVIGSTNSGKTNGTKDRMAAGTSDRTADRTVDRTSDHWRDPFGASLGGSTKAGNGGKGTDYSDFARPVFTAPAKPMFSPGLIRGLITTLIIGTLGAGAALAIISYRQQSGDWLIHMGQKLAGYRSNASAAVSEDTADSSGLAATDTDTPTETNNDVRQPEAKPQPEASKLAPAVPAATAVLKPAAASTPSKAPVTQAPPTTQPLSAAGNSGDTSEVSVDNGSADVAAGERALHGANGTSSPSEAARLFWVAVEKGNTAAEIALADLYVRGEGVPKSCDQARVLLTAAVGKGNSAASSKLLELNNSGCAR